MVTFPNCKINLGLRILAKRTDGYHDLETIFYPVPLFDALEVLEDPNLQDDDIQISGIRIAGDINKNLCLRAIRLLRRDFHTIPFLKVFLHKTIPTGAGLGGGPTDRRGVHRRPPSGPKLGVAGPRSGG